MKKNKEKIYSIAAIVVIIDQLLKLVIKTKLKIFQEIVVIPKFFSIYYIQNNGAAFSILGDKTILLIAISAICIIILDRFITAETKFNKLSIISLGIIMGGIFGNLIDRLLYHSVIDFLSFSIFKYNFPVFNIADIGITIGTVLLIISFIKPDPKLEKLSENSPMKRKPKDYEQKVDNKKEVNKNVKSNRRRPTNKN